MSTNAPVIDLHFLNTPRVIGTAVLADSAGVTLIDPGPTSCLPSLERGLHTLGLRLDDVRVLLLTHIHLDHAGATGTLLQRLPKAVAYVHERGAPHLVEPSRLLASATRLYGSNMHRFWGEFHACPADRLRVLVGGERIDVAGATLQVRYTPGHASHHVSYFDEHTATAYVGDTAGIRTVGDYVKAPTPPPDIDLALWEESLQTIEAWQPRSLVLTHFGAVRDVDQHLQLLRAALARQAALVKATLERPGTDEERMMTFVAAMRADARRTLSDEEATASEAAAALDQLWLGLARYWRREQPQPSAPAAPQ